MIRVSKELAPVLVAAIRDAMKFNTSLAESETIKDPTDIEEYLINLGNLEMEVRRQYESLEHSDNGMLRYEQLWNQLPT